MSSGTQPPTVTLTVDGEPIEVVDHGGTLLEALREQAGRRSVKDGCSPQGQCGCCTVLVDGQPRVSCVTPLRRVRGRAITTVDGLDDATEWAEALCATGGSQCGFCTPGIVVRLSGLRATKPDHDDDDTNRALLAHLCRCTGWQTIVEADALRREDITPGRDRDLAAATERAALETGGAQLVAPRISLGDAGFADDTAPDDAVVAVLDDDGNWVVRETLAEARRAAGTVQGRRTTADPTPPLDLPPVEGAVAALRTQWVEPAPLEIDASWCVPGGTPASPLANGGAFGAKTASIAPATARRLADEHGVPVRVVLRREDAVRLGPKRPPVAGAIRADGTGTIRVVATDGIAERIEAIAPGLTVEEVAVPGPPTSTALRAAGWAEAQILLSALHGNEWTAVGPAGGRARAHIDDGTVRIWASGGAILDEVVARSYAIGAAHQALSWVTSEALTVDADGVVHDRTIRSFGILRAVDMPHVDVTFDDSDAPPEPIGDAVFIAVAAAAWRAAGRSTDWPTQNLRG